MLTTSRNSRDLTNAVFLFGAYMIKQLSAPVNAVLNLLEFTLPSCLAYRDVSRGPPTFKLHLRDCWEGLYQAKELGWADLSPEGMDLDEYETLDNPLNADLHEVIRGKFIAMRSPRSLPNGDLWIDGPDRLREFAPAHYAGIIQQLGARTIVRLNEARYDASEFEAVGIAVVDIPFDDCTALPHPPAPASCGGSREIGARRRPVRSRTGGRGPAQAARRRQQKQRGSLEGRRQACRRAWTRRR